MTVTVIAEGDTSKNDPFTICIVASPAFEDRVNSNTFSPDPVTIDEGKFNDCVSYVCDALFGRQTNQGELALGDAQIGPKVRIVSIFDKVEASAASALVALEDKGNMLVPRRLRAATFVRERGVNADVIFAVSRNGKYSGASAYPATDDVARGGTPFTFDGDNFTHCHYSEVPGTVAIHVTADSLTALHEFQHAMGSYENGIIVDLYVDCPTAGFSSATSLRINFKRRHAAGDVIPKYFAEYNGKQFASDPTRDSMGYPPAWTSYHCGLHDKRRVAIMDTYRTNNPRPNACQNDTITRAFLHDRLRAKLER
jgi:hypothetical protein